MYNNDDSLEQMASEKPFRHFLKHEYFPSFVESYHSFREHLSNAKDGAVDLFHRTALEIPVLFMLAASVASPFYISDELALNRSKKLGFSEIEDKEDNAKRKGGSVPHSTEFVGKAADYFMKVFEASNLSYRDGFFTEDNTQTFATELEIKVKDKIYPQYLLPELRVRIPELRDSLKKDFTYLVQLSDNCSIAVKYYRESWTDTHNDVERMEIYFESVTDSEGNSHSEMRTRWVYDHTDNTYKYHSTWGNQASTQSDNMKVWFPYIVFKENFVLATKTHAENEYAIEKSRRKQLKGRTLTPQEYIDITNSSLTGSVLYLNLQAIDETHRQFMITGNVWSEQKNTAQSYSKTTYDHSHAESKEFSTTRKAMEQAKDLISLVGGLGEVVDHTTSTIITLDSKIDEYIGAVKDHKGGDTDKMKSEIMELAEEGYNHLSPQGVELDSANWLRAAGWISLWGTIFGAIGAGLNFADNKWDIYRRTLDWTRRKKK